MSRPTQNGVGNSNVDSDEEAAALVSSRLSPVNIETPSSSPQLQVNDVLRRHMMTFWDEVWSSTELLFRSKLTWLLLGGPIAVYGDSTGFIGEATCFACAGLALIPCADRDADFINETILILFCHFAFKAQCLVCSCFRLSFVTEQVAEHTNGTIGALLNATFGNAPEVSHPASSY